MNWIPVAQYEPSVETSMSGIYKSSSALVDIMTSDGEELGYFVHYRYVAEAGKMQSKFFWRNQSGKLIKAKMWRPIIDDHECSTVQNGNRNKTCGSGDGQDEGKRMDNTIGKACGNKGESCSDNGNICKDSEELQIMNVKKAPRC